MVDEEKPPGKPPGSPSFFILFSCFFRAKQNQKGRTYVHNPVTSRFEPSRFSANCVASQRRRTNPTSVQSGRPRSSVSPSRPWRSWSFGLLIWLGLKKPESQNGASPGKWNHGPKPAVCPSCLILSHTHFFVGLLACLLAWLAFPRRFPRPPLLRGAGMVQSAGEMFRCVPRSL